MYTRGRGGVGKEGDFGASMDKEGVDGLVVGFKAPGGDALLLDGEELGESDVCGEGIGGVLQLIL